ncbi:LacI family transcriptional regulator [Actinomadura mexicana]|uniref:Uncharacterized protein n=1 Tax=Actinomadura mexicana TaxID=134959 RepID=A0A238Z8C5_9ACTN|nr:LacI family transcriptional regulator [Actinomadura mexicana]SNR79309.1 hypothetical protein SAMN06265355_10725 [Actinomadura mexicana]
MCHRHIGSIGGPPDTNFGQERFGGYEQALREHGLLVDERLVERGPFEPAFGSDPTDRLLHRTPEMTALLAAFVQSWWPVRKARLTVP